MQSGSKCEIGNLKKLIISLFIMLREKHCIFMLRLLNYVKYIEHGGYIYERK